MLEWGPRWEAETEGGYVSLQLSRSLLLSSLHCSLHCSLQRKPKLQFKAWQNQNWHFLWLTLNWHTHLWATQTHQLPLQQRHFKTDTCSWEKIITRMIVSTSILVLGSRSSHSDSSELFVSLFGSMKRKKENKRLEKRLVSQGRAAQLWAAWTWVTVGKMLLKHKQKPNWQQNKGSKGKDMLLPEKQQWFCNLFR